MPSSKEAAWIPRNGNSSSYRHAKARQLGVRRSRRPYWECQAEGDSRIPSSAAASRAGRVRKVSTTPPPEFLYILSYQPRAIFSFTLGSALLTSRPIPIDGGVVGVFDWLEALYFGNVYSPSHSMVRPPSAVPLPLQVPWALMPLNLPAPRMALHLFSTLCGTPSLSVAEPSYR